MTVRIEDISNPPFLGRGGISETSKFVVIDDGGSRPIKILVGTTHRTFRNTNGVDTEMIRTPNKNVFEADLVIATDIVVRKFNIIKNRYGRNEGGDIVPYYFLNRTLDELIRPLLQNPTIYDIQYVKAEIIRVFAMITGEQFWYVDNKWLTARDMYTNNYLIKYKPLKHKFVNA
jgi:hypothetical protein